MSHHRDEELPNHLVCQMPSQEYTVREIGENDYGFVNAIGMTDRYESTKRYWMESTGEPWSDICSNCDGVPTTGTYMHYRRDGLIYIVPMCDGCRSHINEGVMFLRKGTLIVRDPESDVTLYSVRQSVLESNRYCTIL